MSANTAVTRSDSPVSSATSRNNPAPACDPTPSPSADAFTRKPLRYSSPRKCLPTRIIYRELSHYPLQDRHFR